ncbi:MAG: M48 family metallopeptidase [Nitrospiraceae bacterium]|nr:M48 family metallopeptidase [Nitrospiraceae bacterium]
MGTYRLAILICYLFVQGFEYWLRYINLRYMRSHGTEVPAGFEGYVDRSVLEKTHAYSLATSRLSLAESIFSSGVMVVFLFGGLLDRYSGWTASFGLSFVPAGVLFFLVLVFVNTLLSAPFSLYGTFRIENRYGFNTMTPSLWVADLLKSLFLSTAILGIALAAGLYIVRMSPGLWWLFAWGFFFVLSIFLMYISPYVIEPLFNKFTPLGGGELETRIREMMERVGIHVKRVFTIDASKRSTHTNAYFTGIGRTKRIVLFDTLIRMMEPEEILAVLAHEAGHWKKKHVLKRIAVFELLSLIGAYLAFRILGTGFLADVFAIRGETFFASLIILGFLFGIAAFPFTPLSSFVSRRHEDEADRFASELTGRPESLATSLIKLSKDNLSNLHPHPLYAKFYFSHPPVVERVRKLRGLQ